MWIVLNSKHIVVCICESEDAARDEIDVWTDHAGCMGPYTVRRMK